MKRVVIKIGSSSLIGEDGKVDQEKIANLIRQISLLKKNDVAPLLVTSGAIAVGKNKLKLDPKTIPLKQACAAVGQANLMQIYEQICFMYHIRCAQILLNNDDFSDRTRMLNLENTIETLLEYDILPIINENDALNIDEIKVGDNDRLSALISPMVKADLLVLISDIDGLYSSNPKTNKDAQLIKKVPEITQEIYDMAQGTNSNVGTGGMITKIRAAKIATSCGVDMIIMNNSKIENLSSCLSIDNYEGTLFLKSENKLKSKEQWILFNTKTNFDIIVDEGCKKAIINNSSLLPKGIKDVIGDFKTGSIVNVKFDDSVIAKGIVNYSSEEILKIKGHDTTDIEEILGYIGKKTVIHIDSLAIGGF